MALLLAILVYRYKESLTSLLIDSSNAQRAAETNTPSPDPPPDYTLLGTHV